ncbi:MAG: transporter substrate-binding domain-containing protein [Candidatus Limiplasma sp.]|nr:transporter substrate-binding domain-containing protein [Candidatus Limiplasma sp.]
MKKTVSILLALTLLLTGAAALAEGTLRVGMECAYAPYNWTQADAGEFTVPIEGGAGYADGYDVQIAKTIAEGLGKELVIVKTEWDGLPPAVTSGAIDAIIAGMSPTEERKATLDFTDPYYLVDMVIVVKKDGPFAAATSLADFSGAALTAQLNTTHYDVIDQIAGVTKLPAMDTFPAMIVALRSGAIDGYIAERPGALADTTANPELTFVAFEQGKGFDVALEDTLISIGLNKGSELVAPINTVLAGLDQATRDQMMSDAISRQPLAQ